MGKFQVAHEDIYQRINYLYQAAYASIKSNPNDLSICRFYVYTLKVITRRHVLHLHPDMKRNMCKRCCMLLIPGVTSIVRIKKKRQKQTINTCLECGTIKRYVYNPNKIPWINKPEAWEDRLVNGNRVAGPQNNQPKQKQKNKNQSQNQQGNQKKSNQGNKVQEATADCHSLKTKQSITSGHLYKAKV